MADGRNLRTGRDRKTDTAADDGELVAKSTFIWLPSIASSGTAFFVGSLPPGWEHIGKRLRHIGGRFAHFSSSVAKSRSLEPSTDDWCAQLEQLAVPVVADPEVRPLDRGTALASVWEFLGIGAVGSQRQLFNAVRPG
jgi:hypothetical protein